MMGWKYGAMGWEGFGSWAILYHIIILIDLVLLGLWLWKQIQKK